MAGPMAPAAVEVWRLPLGSGELFGRRRELEVLDEAWASQRVNMVVLTGWGGVGKTSILSHWVASMAARGYDGAERVFAWSFDAQIDGGSEASSDQFIDAALRFFAVEPMPAQSTWERCRQLITLLQQARTILLVDGLEHLQEPHGPSRGVLREPVVRMLLKELAALNQGLVVVTSRLELVDVGPFLGKTCRAHEVDALAEEAAIEILRGERLRGSDEELVDLAGEVGCHAMSLRLLGSYIRTVFGGDTTKWRAQDLSAAVRSAGSAATAVMAQYAAWFADRPEAQILSLLGLFDGPASTDELDVLRAVPVVPGLNDLIQPLSRDEWAYALSDLRAAGLLLPDDRWGRIDAHPLVRHHFGEAHRGDHPGAHVEGHRRLFESMVARGPRKPATIEDCVPLLSAVWHGVKANLIDEVLDEVYWPLLAQDSHFLRDGLGAAATNFMTLQSILSADHLGALGSRRKAQLLVEQSLDLRMMGTPEVAVAPLEEAVELARPLGDAVLLANMLRHLAQLHLSLGQMEPAGRAALDAVEVAGRRDPSDLERIASHITLASIHLSAGRYEPAAATLAASGLVGADIDDLAAHHAHRATFYIALYRAGDVALTLHRMAPEVIHSGLRTARDLLAFVEHQIEVAWATSNDHTQPLAHALLSVLRVRLDLATDVVNDGSAVRMDEAVTALRFVGQRPWLVEGILWRSRVLATLQIYDAAARDIREARDIVEADRMTLQSLLCRHEVGRLEAAQANHAEARLIASSVLQEAEAIGAGLIVDLSRQALSET